ncbi:MAG: glycoside hydrolase family 24 [Alphaproteobacteria bacterium CG11_big_fil_rev_8_21_14_0_20_44_7]|nr:MAG: glycoside hydrolase family 24 [Alphaproteobacteria bacterium CG11_big_fil_rev_8_21_14_0_20_44_7]
MSFHEIRFPTDISFGSSGGPLYSTDVITMHSGAEQRNANWANARTKYNVAHAVKTNAQVSSLIDFFRNRQGRAYGFRFKDWSDYSANAVQIAVGDDSETDFQLVKIYMSGSESVSRVIKKPVAGSVKIYFDDVEQVSGWTLDATSGIVSFAAAPASAVVITADFEFDVPVRFDTDYLPSNFESYGVNSIGNIPLIEIRI